MSRSYKYSPVYTSGGKIAGTRKYWKRQANKKFRKEKGFSGKSMIYKKFYESWDIRDYTFYMSMPCDTQSEDFRRWERYYHRK